GRDISFVALARGARPDHAFGDQNLRRELVRAKQSESMLLENVSDTRQQTIVAATKQSRDARHQPDRLPIEPDLPKRRSDQIADEDQVATVLRGSETAHPAELTQGDPVMRITLDRSCVSESSDRKQDRPAPAPRRGVGY